MPNKTHRTAYYIVNGITLYRLVAVGLLIYLIIRHDIDTYKWLLLISFATDAIDGFLARKYKVTSKFGARLDSAADDLTVVAAAAGVFVFFPEFIKQQRVAIIVMLGFYLLQLALALIKYKKISTFHTYIAKVAALLQGAFLIPIFFMKEPTLWLFYAAVAVTLIDLIEETILVILLPQNRTDVKGLYWVLQERRKRL